MNTRFVCPKEVNGEYFNIHLFICPYSADIEIKKIERNDNVYMAKPRVPMELQSKKVSKEEREARIEAERKLVGDRDLLLRPPSYLNKQEKKIYKELIKPLLHIESLGNSDREIFAIMANAKAMMLEAKKSIENDGMLIPKIDRFGNVEMKENPCIKIYKDYESIFNKNQSQIGLSASARTKLVQIKQEKEEENELDNILGALRS